MIFAHIIFCRVMSAGEIKVGQRLQPVSYTMNGLGLIQPHVGGVMAQRTFHLRDGSDTDIGHRMLEN